MEEDDGGPLGEGDEKIKMTTTILNTRHGESKIEIRKGENAKEI